jgi:hypothetical protein
MLAREGSLRQRKTNNKLSLENKLSDFGPALGSPRLIPVLADADSADSRGGFPDRLKFDSTKRTEGGSRGGRDWGVVTLRCEEARGIAPYGFSSGRDDLVPRTHRRGA